MKYIINAIMFLIIIYSLTVMPIDMKALQVDVSWEKYKRIEEKKENEKQQAVIEETVKTSPYNLSYSGDSYLFNPSEIKLTLSGDEKLPDLISDVVTKLTFEWINVVSGDMQILSVPSEAVTIGPVSGTTETSTEITVRLTTLTQIPDGQYKVKIRSQSDLTKENSSIDLDTSWFKKTNYKAYDKKDFGAYTAITLFYPTADGSGLIPITEGVSNSRILRKIATLLYTGQSENTDLKTGQLIPRIRNIQLKGGKLNLYTTTADLTAAKANGLSPTQMTDILSKSYFSLPYVEEIHYFVDNKTADATLTKLDAAAPTLRQVASNEFYQLTTVGSSLFYISTPKQFTSTAEVLNTLSTPDASMKGKKAVQVIPANVKLSATADPANPKICIVDLQVTGTLYGEQMNLAHMMLDTIAINLMKSGLVEEVRFTVNGQPTELLNQVPLTEAYPVPTFLNVKTSN